MNVLVDTSVWSLALRRSRPSGKKVAVLKDLIDSGLVPVTRLQVTFRQKEDSGIEGTAHGILAGRGAADRNSISPFHTLGRA